MAVCGEAAARMHHAATTTARRPGTRTTASEADGRSRRCQTPTGRPFALLWFPRSPWSPSIPRQELVQFGFQAVDQLPGGSNLSNQVNNAFSCCHGWATYQKTGHATTI